MDRGSWDEGAQDGVPGAWAYGGPPAPRGGRPFSGARTYGATPTVPGAVPTGSPRRRLRRRLLAVAAVLVPLVAVGGSVAAHGTGRTTAEPTHVATTVSTASTASSTDPGPLAQVSRDAAVARLLQARSTALLAGDLAGWLRTVDRSNRAVVVRQTALFRDLRALPLARYGWTAAVGSPVSGYALPAGLRPGFDPGDAYSPWVQLTYQLKGFDPGPVQRDQVPVLVNRGGHWLLAGDQTRTVFPRTIVEPWDDAPVAVARGPHVVVVLSSADASRLPAVVAQAERALANARAMWPQASGSTAVLYLTGDQDALKSYAGRMQIADFGGLTVDVTAPGSRLVGTRVLTNPLYVTPTSADLGRLLTHEFTHVVQWADQGSGTPLWAVEGLAEYTAYRDDKYAERVSSEIGTRAKQRTLPATLPASEHFYSPPAGSISFRYGMSWLAWQYIADTYGEGKVRALYAQLRLIGWSPDSSRAMDAEHAAFRGVLGIEEPLFVKRLNAWVATVIRGA